MESSCLRDSSDKEILSRCGANWGKEALGSSTVSDKTSPGESEAEDERCLRLSQI